MTLKTRTIRSAAALLLAGAGALPAPVPARAQDTPVTLHVMAFNIWYGGIEVDLSKVADAVRAAGADIVLLQEPGGATRAIAEALGWPYADEAHHVIARYPIYPPRTGEDGYALVEIAPDRVVAAASVHLTASPYGPYELRDGATAESVMALERTTRLLDIQATIDALEAARSAGIPAFVGGDFNSPSGRDWTEAAIAAGLHGPTAFAWPAAGAMEAAGYVDSYRAAHPDPVARPGSTWTAGYPSPHLNPDEVMDRIDFVFAGGAAAIASKLVGEPGGPDVDVAIDPWPSDHRAIVSTFEVTPVPAAALVASARRTVRVGETITLRYGGSDATDGSLGIMQAGAEAMLASMPIGDRSDFRAMEFGTAELAPGAYDAVLVAADGKILARAPFWVLAPQAVPAVRTDAQRYAAGAPITVRWENAPGNRLDWVGLFPADEPSLYGYAAFLYTGAAVDGAVTFDADAIGGTLPPGRYVARLMRDDLYVVLAGTPFEVE
jgi:endonuclease/exonuclease/phosphatase family metal-dependent hydrolase